VQAYFNKIFDLKKKNKLISPRLPTFPRTVVKKKSFLFKYLGGLKKVMLVPGRKRQSLNFLI